MTTKNVLLLVSPLLLVMANLAAAPVQQAAAVPLFEDHFPPPQFVSAFVKQVDAVARIVVESAIPGTQVSPMSGRSSIVTHYSVRVLDPIKPAPMLPARGQALMLTRRGGQGIIDGRQIREFNPNFEDFTIGAEYILFLQWNRYRNEFDVAYGEDGAYHIDRGVIRPLGKAASMQSVRGRDAATWIEEIRADSVVAPRK